MTATTQRYRQIGRIEDASPGSALARAVRAVVDLQQQVREVGDRTFVVVGLRKAALRRLEEAEQLAVRAVHDPAVLDRIDFGDLARARVMVELLQRPAEQADAVLLHHRRTADDAIRFRDEQWQRYQQTRHRVERAHTNVAFIGEERLRPMIRELCELAGDPDDSA